MCPRVSMQLFHTGTCKSSTELGCCCRGTALWNGPDSCFICWWALGDIWGVGAGREDNSCLSRAPLSFIVKQKRPILCCLLQLSGAGFKQLSRAPATSRLLGQRPGLEEASQRFGCLCRTCPRSRRLKHRWKGRSVCLLAASVYWNKLPCWEAAEESVFLLHQPRS